MQIYAVWFGPLNIINNTSHKATSKTALKFWPMIIFFLSVPSQCSPQRLIKEELLLWNMIISQWNVGVSVPYIPAWGNFIDFKNSLVWHFNIVWMVHIKGHFLRPLSVLCKLNTVCTLCCSLYALSEYPHLIRAAGRVIWGLVSPVRLL